MGERIKIERFGGLQRVGTEESHRLEYGRKEREGDEWE